MSTLPRLRRAHCVILVSVLTCGAVASMAVFAQTTGIQQYLVHVQQSVSITPPKNVELTHDLSSNPQAFPPQSWIVAGNTTHGVTVNFAVTKPFTHSTNASFRRDARLSLATGSTTGPASWAVTQPSASTNYVGNVNGAVVTARSNNVGRANMLLTVTFVTGDPGLLLAGDYVTTVTGTVSANP